jgi:hypothetical protein
MNAMEECAMSCMTCICACARHHGLNRSAHLNICSVELSPGEPQRSAKFGFLIVNVQFQLRLDQRARGSIDPMRSNMNFITSAASRTLRPRLRWPFPGKKVYVSAVATGAQARRNENKDLRGCIMTKASKPKSKTEAKKKPAATAAAVKKKSAVSSAPPKKQKAAAPRVEKPAAKPAATAKPQSKPVAVAKAAPAPAAKPAVKPAARPAETAPVDWSNAIAAALQKKHEQKGWPGGGEAWKGKKRSRF